MSVVNWIDWSKQKNYVLVAHIAQKMLNSTDEKERLEGMKMCEILEKSGYEFKEKYQPLVM